MNRELLSVSQFKDVPDGGRFNGSLAWNRVLTPGGGRLWRSSTPVGVFSIESHGMPKRRYYRHLGPGPYGYGKRPEDGRGEGYGEQPIERWLTTFVHKRDMDDNPNMSLEHHINELKKAAVFRDDAQPAGWRSQGWQSHSLENAMKDAQSHMDYLMDSALRDHLMDTGALSDRVPSSGALTREQMFRIAAGQVGR